MSNANPSQFHASPDAAATALNKRYEGLVALRAKAVKGKGAWYWAHFEPFMIRNPESNLPASVKLKCTLCNAAFSASNPSRTASEHLKRGTCPNSSLMMMKPISQLPPLASPSSQPKHRKRSPESLQTPGTSLDVDPINTVYSSRTANHEMSFLPSQISSPKPVILSGGRDDLRPLAQLEDSVKKLKSPKASPVPILTQNQVDTAFDLLTDWFHESCGSVSFSSLEHPKFKAFLNQVGLPEPSKRELFSCARLDSKFAEARSESEARINEADFFQVSCDGWENNNNNLDGGGKCLVKFIVNLPNGTRVFQRAVCLNIGELPSQYVEEVMWESVQRICGDNSLHRCVGIVSDKYKSKALRNLETRSNWMVNIFCQRRGFSSLIKDFIRELPIFRSVKESCLKISNLINCHPHVRNGILKLRSQGLEFSGFIRFFSSKCDISRNWGSFISMLEDILKYAQILHHMVFDDSYKAVCLENHDAREVSGIIRDAGFWKDLEGAHSLVNLIMETCKEIEIERPLIGQCLPLWDELRAKAKNLCTKHGLTEGPVLKIIEARFMKNYHPAWSAAFILDPLNLVKDASGKYLPPFDYLTNEQERDVESLVIRLVPKEEGHAALMELNKWRSEGLDPLYAQAVQVRQRDSLTGKIKIANPQSSRLVWETCLKEINSLSKVASRLLFMHATSFGFTCDWAMTRWFCGPRVGLERAQKMVFVAAHAKLERRDFSSGEERDEEMINEVIVHKSSI
ncbi:hypothetical protein CASFOL_002024 [Castilleja foliolosa]|uniref:DUF7963 domain-containing protein n=1 Tax=Castilleja foliolosa TaxID=1961234 RepID=A0ABD3ED36_9LAMI